MQTIEIERAAYITNDPTAALLARIASLESINESLENENYDLRESLDKYEMES
jgi:exonuclease VII small subunit